MRSETVAGTAGRAPVWETWTLNFFAGLTILLMVAIAVQVACSFFDINPLVAFTTAVPVLGRAVTLNSLLDLQWHFLVIIGLLPSALVWRRDRHVRVDFLYAGWTPRRRAWIDLIGHLLLTAPFLAMCIPASWAFMERAWVSAEMSPNGGLTDRFLIKAMLPAGFVLLAAALVADLPGLARRALGRGDR
ncbi:MAG: TRAP transporter small permease subunit [Inquilinaceae bacterium]